MYFEPILELFSNSSYYYDLLFQVPSELEWCESVMWIHLSYNVWWFREPLNIITGMVFFLVHSMLMNSNIIKNNKNTSYITNTLLWIASGTVLYHGSLFPIFKMIDQMSILMLLFYISFYYYGHFSIRVKRYIDICGVIFVPVFLVFPILGDISLFLLGICMCLVGKNDVTDNTIIYTWYISIFMWILDKMCLNINGIYLPTHWLFHICTGYLAYYGILYLEKLSETKRINEINRIKTIL